MQKLAAIAMAVALVALPASTAASSAAPLTLLSAADAGDGVCLDGSPPGYYHWPANTTADPEAATKYVLYFKGGGWCYDEDSCASRSMGPLGSAAHFPKEFGFGAGPSSASAELNPTFVNWNRIILWYCDGASWTGARSGTVSWPAPHGKGNVTLYFRGALALDSVLKVLKRDAGLDNATEVLRGLSTFLQADKVAAALPRSVKKVKAVPGSGLFLEAPDVQGTAVYPDEMQYVFHMQNSTNGVSKKCQAAQAPGQEWKCIFAEHAMEYLELPVFPLNSFVDSWQLGNIFAPSGLSSHWQKCFDKSTEFADCNSTQIADLITFGTRMLDVVAASRKLNAPGNGGFFHSCEMHVGLQGSGWTRYMVTGTNMQQAVEKWFNGDDKAPASENTYIDCMLTATAPHHCNPTCQA